MEKWYNLKFNIKKNVSEDKDCDEQLGLNYNNRKKCIVIDFFEEKCDYNNFYCMFRLKEWIDGKKINWEDIDENVQNIFYPMRKFKKRIVIRDSFLLEHEDFFQLKNSIRFIESIEPISYKIIALKKNRFLFEKFWEKLSDQEKVQNIDCLLNSYLIEYFEPEFTRLKKIISDQIKENIIDAICFSKKGIELLIKYSDFFIPIVKKKCCNIFWLKSHYIAEALPILENNESKLNWISLNFGNFEVLKFLEKHPDKINWSYLSENKDAIPILEKNLDKINYFYISNNPNAIHLLEKYIEDGDLENKIYWGPSNEINPNKISIHKLCSNKNGIRILEKLLEIYGETYVHKLNWKSLSSNPNAICLLEKYKQFIDYSKIVLNPAIFEVDYDFLKKRMDIIRSELLYKFL